MQEAGDDDEAEELPEAVVVVLNKMSLKPEQFDIEVASSDDAQAKKTKKEALSKKMAAKINPSRSGPTQSQLEACFKFGQADKDDSFYLAQKPTSDHKKFYAQKLASILVNGNFTISDDDE